MVSSPAGCGLLAADGAGCGFLVSLSVLTCAAAVACLGPRKGEVPMSGIELFRPHAMALLMVADMEHASLGFFPQGDR